MKTLEDAAKEYAETIRPITGLDKHDAPYVTAFEHNEDIEQAVVFGANWQKQQSGWISVKENLPEKQGFVIAAKRNGLVLGMYYNDDNEFKSCEIDQTNQVTHWQPLPEAPKE